MGSSVQSEAPQAATLGAEHKGSVQDPDEIAADRSEEQTYALASTWMKRLAFFWAIWNGLATKAGVMHSGHGIGVPCGLIWFLSYSNWLTNSTFSFLSIVFLLVFLLKDFKKETKELSCWGKFWRTMLALITCYGGGFTFLYLTQGGTTTAIEFYKRGCGGMPDEIPARETEAWILFSMGLAPEGTISFTQVFTMLLAPKMFFRRLKLHWLTKKQIAGVIFLLLVSFYGTFNVMAASKFEFDEDNFNQGPAWFLTVASTVGYWLFYIPCVVTLSMLLFKAFSKCCSCCDFKKGTKPLLDGEEQGEEIELYTGWTDVIANVFCVLLLFIFLLGNPSANGVISAFGSAKITNTELYGLKEGAGKFLAVQIVGGICGGFNSLAASLFFFQESMKIFSFLKGSTVGHYVNQSLTLRPPRPSASGVSGV